MGFMGLSSDSLNSVCKYNLNLCMWLTSGVTYGRLLLILHHQNKAPLEFLPVGTRCSSKLKNFGTQSSNQIREWTTFLCSLCSTWINFQECMLQHTIVIKPWAWFDLICFAGWTLSASNDPLLIVCFFTDNKSGDKYECMHTSVMFETACGCGKREAFSKKF